MKKRRAKRIVTFLLAIFMAAAMPISINAAESPAEPLSMNAGTATFKHTFGMYFDLYSDDTVYGEYTTTVVFKNSSDNPNEVYSATVYPDITWYKRFPEDLKTGYYRVKLIFEAVYQRMNHYSYGSVTQTFNSKSFYYSGENSGHVRVPQHTFYVKEPTDDPLGFNYWVKFYIRVELYPPDVGIDTIDGFVSYDDYTVNYGDVIKQF